MAKRNPKQCGKLTVETVDEFKKIDCAFYADCLDDVIEKSWSQFHCRSCKSYKKEQDGLEDFVELAKVSNND